MVSGIQGSPSKTTQDRTWIKDSGTSIHPTRTYRGIVLHQRKIPQLSNNNYYSEVCCLLGPMTYGRYSCSIDKLSFPSFSIFNFLLQLPISSYLSQIIKELCSSSSSSSYSFHFRHLILIIIMMIIIIIITISLMTKPHLMMGIYSNPETLYKIIRHEPNPTNVYYILYYVF